jgi:hypothetical protein
VEIALRSCLSHSFWKALQYSKEVTVVSQFKASSEQNWYIFFTPFHHLAYQVPLRSACFSLFSSCGAAGLRGTFPGHPRPPFLLLSPFFWTTPAHPAWDSNPADLAVVSEECRSSFHHPTVSPWKTYTHPWPGGGFSLGKNPPPSVRFETTSAGTATSEHCLRQPCGRFRFKYIYSVVCVIHVMINIL